MPEEIIRIEYPNILIVEGLDEKYFFDAFISFLNLKEIQILDIGGKTKIRPNLELLAKTPNFSIIKSLGIIRDANSNPETAFQSVIGALRLANKNLGSDTFPIPQSHLEFVGIEPRLGVMILPKDDQPGMLEDVCLKAVENDCAMVCIDEFFDCIIEKQCIIPNNISKAKIHVFLASRIEAGKRLGEAAQAGFFPWDSEAFLEIRDFLFKLLE